jgi:predicted DNA-binding ribbon-helix-helix protein
MCQIFINSDPRLWQSKARSLRLHGVATSIRLETLYWRILEEIGARDSMKLNQLITKLHDELIDAHGQVDNFASFLRVCCGRYLMLQIEGRIPADLGIPIRSLDPAYVLAGERLRTPEAERRAPRAIPHSPRA